MAKKKINDVDLLLSKLDKKQLEIFIRNECSNNMQFQDRFLALGAGTVFRPNPEIYASRIKDLIWDFGGRHGHIEYSDTFDFNRDVTRILDEADEAIIKGQWKVAIAVLTGIVSVAEDILNSGDDSAGELGAIVSDCFEKWHELCTEESLPEDIRSEIFELSLSRFNERDIHTNPSTFIIDDAPKEVKNTFRDEIIDLYTSAVNRFFQRASDRKSYQVGVNLLRNLIKYGGKKEANRIVAEQKSRTPRRPALIEELSKL